MASVTRDGPSVSSPTLTPCLTLGVWLRFLVGDRAAILTVANSRSALWVGLLFALSAGFAREYDGAYLAGEPWHFVLPVAASLVTSGILFLLILFCCRSHEVAGFPVKRGYRTVLTFFWMTAPLAWLYAVPVERWLDPGQAAETNLWFLGIVSVWRVLLITRALAVWLGESFWTLIWLVLFFGDTVAIALAFVTPTPVWNIMGGVRLPEQDSVVLGAKLGIWFFGIPIAAILCIGTIIAMSIRKSTWLPQALPNGGGKVSSSLWAVAGLLLIAGFGLLPFGQEEQQHAWQAAQLLRSGDVEEGVRYISQSDRAAFPPHWNPPPRLSYGEDQPQLDDVLDAVHAQQAPDWLKDIFVEKLFHSYSGLRNSIEAAEKGESGRLEAALDLLEKKIKAGEKHQYYWMLEEAQSNTKLDAGLRKRIGQYVNGDENKRGLVAHEEPAAPIVAAVDEARTVPEAIRAVMAKPIYKDATWGLRVIDLETGQMVYELGPTKPMLTGSVRKLFTIAEALDRLGPGHTFVTPVYRTGEVQGGVLAGDLVLVAAGDLAMGGRTNADGSIAFTDFDHNEANSLGNAVLTAPDPLAGYKKLAEQVAAAGIREIAGDVIVDDRLFVPFDYRGEFKVRPIFVNDDVVDVILRPGVRFKDADVTWRPHSAAFGVKNALVTTPPGTQTIVKLEPELPPCIGRPGCMGEVSGQLTENMKPPLTDKFPMIRTFRIVEPQNYARTVLIEALEKVGVNVGAAAVSQNAAADKLPPRGSYSDNRRVAELVSQPYEQYAKWILKVSYNIGADTSLVLFGLTQGADTMAGALAAEKKTLAAEFGVAADEYAFVDGSGGGESAATTGAITTLLKSVSDKSFYPAYLAALPVLGEDGSLAFVTDFAKDGTLAGAKGQVRAKTGTFVSAADENTMSLRAQGFAGYIDAKSGRRLAYVVVVNDIPKIDSIYDVMQVFQDQGTISAIIWREN